MTIPLFIFKKGCCKMLSTNEFRFSLAYQEEFLKHSRYSESNLETRKMISDVLTLYDIENDINTLKVRDTVVNDIDVYFVSGLELKEEDIFKDLCNEKELFKIRLFMKGNNNPPSIIILEDYFELFFESFAYISKDMILDLKPRRKSYEFKIKNNNDRDVFLMCMMVKAIYDEVECIIDTLYRKAFYMYSNDTLQFSEFSDEAYEKCKASVYEPTHLVMLAFVYNALRRNKKAFKKFLKLKEYVFSAYNEDGLYYSILVSVGIGLCNNLESEDWDWNTEIYDKITDLIDKYLTGDIGNNYFRYYLELAKELKEIYKGEVE